MIGVLIMVGIQPPFSSNGAKLEELLVVELNANSIEGNL
jgi:hypothetical protein